MESSVSGHPMLYLWIFSSYIILVVLICIYEIMILSLPVKITHVLNIINFIVDLQKKAKDKFSSTFVLVWFSCSENKTNI